MSTLRYCTRCLTTFDGDPDRCTNLGCARARPEAGWDALLSPGDVLDRHYVIEQALALGGAGLTYRARELGADGQPTGPTLAVKVLYAQRDQGSFLRRLSNEAQILQELDHPNLVESRGFVHRAGHPPYLVTLFEPGGNLGEYLETHGPLAPRVAAGVLSQVLQALHTAHRRGIVHRDLKPENVLLRERTPPDQVPPVRVADFGIAKVEALGGRVTRQGAFVGTPEFAAPEQFEGRDPTPATDIYAAGALFYTLLTGRDLVAFTDRLDVARCYDELAAHLPPVAPDTIVDATERALCQAILEGMTRLEPDRRWEVPLALEALAGLARGDAADALAEIGRPPPVVPPRDAQGPPTLDDDEPLPDEGGFGAAAFGLGAPLVGAALAVPLVGALRLGVAAFTGHFSGLPDPAASAAVAPVVVKALPSTPARDLSRATEGPAVAERDALVAALSRAAGNLPGACGLRGSRTLGMRVGASGVITAIDDPAATPTEAVCVARVLRQAPLRRRSPGEVTLGLALRFAD